MRNKSGFTIIEVVVVIMIMAVMMGIGFPYIMGWLPNFRLRNATRDVHSNLQSARMTAIKQRVNCTVSFVSFTDDNYTKANGTENGYQIYLDGNNNNQYDGKPDDRMLKQVFVQHPTDSSKSAYSNDVTIASVNFTNNGLNEPSITFRSNGLLFGTSNGTVTLARSDDTAKKRDVVVNVAGRILIREP